MTDLLLIGLYALLAGGAIGGAGMLALRLMRGRSIAVHVVVLLVGTVLAVVAGVVTVASAMFLSPHDLRVVLLTVVAAAVVSLAAGVAAGRRLAPPRCGRRRPAPASATWRPGGASWSPGSRTTCVRRWPACVRWPRRWRTTWWPTGHRRRLPPPDPPRDRPMTRLVDDLFELSRINAGALRLAFSQVPLADVVSDAIAAAAPLAADRRIRLVAAQSGWPTVLASEPELARVVTNLLVNSVRYTPPDGTVRIEGGRDAGDAWLAVSDTCGGIPDADLPRVFDVAFRGERARTPAPAGAGGGGLGLAIVRGLVEAHGGRVGVDNTDIGCRFVVRLPTGPAV